jgi:uncharacterized membrane protein
MGISHLGVHLTPTLALWIPFYLFTESSYVLLVLGVASLAAALVLGHLFLVRRLEEEGISAWLRGGISTAVVLFLGLNPYVHTVLQSAHIEVFYVPLSLAFLWSLVFSESLVLPGVLFALALGVREEAGLYLSFQTLAVLFLPKAWVRRRLGLRRLVAVFAVVALLYVVVVVKVVNPLVFGVAENHVARGWSSWGNTWFEVVLAMATSPGRLAKEIWHSAFPSVNGSFYLLPWMNPLFGAAINIPGILLFAADRQDAKQLWYYHASFLLPGFFLGVHAAVWTLTGRVRSRFGPLRLPLPRAVAFVLVVLVASLYWNAVLWRWTPEAPLGYSFREHPAGRTEAAFIRNFLGGCVNVTSVATDFRRTVWVPNRFQRLLLRNAEKADVVFLYANADPMLSTSATGESPGDRLSASNLFIEAYRSEAVLILTRPGVACRTLPVGKP